MSTLSFEQRFLQVEASLNKMMEMLQDAPTIDDGSALVAIIEEELNDLEDQIGALERSVRAMTQQVKIIEKERELIG